MSRRVKGILGAIALIVTLLAIAYQAKAQTAYPVDLWKGLIGESIGNYQRADFDEELYAVACCVRNRLEKGMDIGLVAMKRKDINQFVKENTDYVYNKTGRKVDSVAKSIVKEVFSTGNDTTKGAVYFEDTEKYGKPPYWKEITVRIGTKTFAR